MAPKEWLSKAFGDGDDDKSGRILCPLLVTLACPMHLANPHYRKKRVIETPTDAARPSVPQFFQAGNPRQRLAYRALPATTPSHAGGVWLGGFRSDMLSTKAQRLEDHARAQGHAFLRFDYSGHGESGGAFEDGTIGKWAAESLDMIRGLTSGPQILVGSSMGGWIAFLVARELARLGEADRLAGLVLIAPAVDFTQALMWERLPADAKRDIEELGVWLRHSQYSPEPYPITRGLIEDGRNHLLMAAPMRAHCPVHILQGMEDPDVPYKHALAIVEHLAEDPVALTLIKDGDHRLSREEDIARLIAAYDGIG
jgi:pimeloyl-ACP methyl ester carboxylesterase